MVQKKRRYLSQRPLPVGAIRHESAGLSIALRVQPKSSRDAWAMDESGNIRVHLTAPPVAGAANAALLKFIAKQIGCSRTAIHLVQGAKSRHKVIHISGVSQFHLLNVIPRS